jgi:molybdopterin-containing oxidoreductase family iron-sulfur binding subunit
MSEKMLRGEVDLLFLYQANPLFALPPAWNFKKALQTVPFVVSFSSFRDETGQFAHLILPTHTFLESWGDFSPRETVRGLMQPVMGPILNTRHLGDLLLSTGRRLQGEEKFPENNFYETLRRFWARNEKKSSPRDIGEDFWEKSLRGGGIWEERKDNVSQPLISRTAEFSFPGAAVRLSIPEEKHFHFITYPTVQFFDGRSANRPFLQELPDPMTQITWGGWIEINPETAARLDVKKDDLIVLKSAHGSWQAPAYPYLGIPPGVLAMPLGQGHSGFGQFAGSYADNPVQGISPRPDPLSGGIVWATSGVTVQKAGRSQALANTDGSLYQHGRRLAQGVPWEEYRRSGGQKPSLVLPLPQGFARQDDFYPPHPHSEYRWVMIVDLDRCLGCGACVVACYAENNVAVVGRDQVLFGREMSWLHIERYFEEEVARADKAVGVRFLPMLCQHCDEAPCESVCPVFAPHHSKEGINNQVYNRCIGTRFCSQNCPYKARRFNWFTWPRSQSLDWQLNPEVTVRHKGVMEKCSFCIQRIVAAKVQARSEGRPVRDGEFTTACAQTCPAEALIFGNLLDARSRVAKLIQDPRAYQVLGHLNTKPAVIYLQKITQRI